MLEFVLTYPGIRFADPQSVDQQGSDIYLWQTTVDLQRHYFYLAFNIPSESSNQGASVKKLKQYYCCKL